MDISEFFYRYVFPSVRRRLVEILYRESGLSQEEVAKKTYLTQSAVSRYLRGGRGSYIDLSRFSDVDEMLKELAEELGGNGMDEYALQYRLAKIAFEALSKGYICSYHGRMDPDLNLGRCNICKDLFRRHR